MNKKLIATALVAIFIGTSAVTLNNDNKYFEIAKNLEIFTSVYKELNTHYVDELDPNCLLYTSPSPRDQRGSRMPSSA